MKRSGIRNLWVICTCMSVYLSSVLANAQQLYQRHADGEIWQYIGPPCINNSAPCPGWKQLDNNSLTVAITAGDKTIYQMHADGSIWGSQGSGWTFLDGNKNTVAISANSLGTIFQMHNDGSIWRFAGGNPPWVLLDNNTNTVSITGTASKIQSLFQQHRDGSIWVFTGPPCSGSFCLKWIKLDNNPLTIQVVSGDAAAQLRSDGSILTFDGTPCTNNNAPCPGWNPIDNNPQTIQIAAGDKGVNFVTIYQLHLDGSIWRYQAELNSWEQLDNNPRAQKIAAAGGDLYQLHNDGSIWRYTGIPCTGHSCPGWQKLDNNSATVDIVASFL